MQQFVIRRSHRNDLDGIHRLAHVLNTMNLPDKREALAQLLEKSDASFSGAIENHLERDYLFVLVETSTQQIIGSCQVIAQHGTRDAPHIFFEIYREEHYSTTLDKLIDHQVVRLGFNYDGPTEIGGLVVDPAFRMLPQKLGKQLSLMRFLFIAANRSLFKDKVLAEMMPPMLTPGKSALWEAFGRRFTQLDYLDADFISRTNKEFVKSLLPDIPVYTCLFDESVQKVIGAVGADTEPAARILQSNGFRYNQRCDPFDGGPHLLANTDEISAIKNAQELRVSSTTLNVSGKLQHGLLLSCKNLFTPTADVRCIDTEFATLDDKTVQLSQDSRTALGVVDGDIVQVHMFQS